MRLQTRKLIDNSFTGAGIFSIIFLAAALIVLLAPIIIRGLGAFVFRGTIEYRKVMFSQFHRGDRAAIDRENELAARAREPFFTMMAAFEKEMRGMEDERRDHFRQPYRELKSSIKNLLGPLPDDDTPVLLRQQYGQTRWDRTLVKLDEILHIEEWDHSNTSSMGFKVKSPRVDFYRGTSLEPIFTYLQENIEAMMRPRLTFYWRFLLDDSHDAHFFGGIMPELLGTFYLAFGAMLFAIPIGIISAIYLTEFAGDSRIELLVVRGLRTFISTLAGVPSIVFGLFGLAFFINTIKVSGSKSVLAGSLTLALLILPTIIRASEEAIMAVPQTYKEAALSLGASRWHTVATVILPAALPGILTGIIISMGRAAGETAPIIFTAAVSVGRPLRLGQVFNEPTPALPWNIYNLATEHQAVDEIRHVQFGMVFVLVMLVLALNLLAIILRSRIAKKARG